MTTEPHKPSPSCYRRGCKQTACMDAGHHYAKRYNYDLARGIKRRHDATQARVHIERLTAHQWSHRQIGRACNVPRSTIDIIAAGQPTTSKRIALAILSVPIGPAPGDSAWADATGTIRRIRALGYMQHSQVDLAPRLGMNQRWLSAIACGDPKSIRATEAERVAKVYRELATVLGPSLRARTEAISKGWHGPLAWDDIDDPDSRPETTPGPQGKRERVDTDRVLRLTAEGLSAAHIAERLGTHPRTVIRHRSRAQRAKEAA